ncbi:hypothetical protein Bca52824_064057 [Brassica carinata]|uniref:WRKY domain-containing protein n=1 Tax=Brassica carinata TaxID=52824 RepID=A0A8X7QHL1_BRACI|nr:hypothetical protein Bca52824_064057 [Brassica carinata]
MSGEEEENAAELKIGDEFLKAKCLMNCEVSLILEHKYEQLQQVSEDPMNQVSQVIEKSLQYAKRFSRYKNPDAVRQVREYHLSFHRILSRHQFTEFELCVLGNLCLETAKEAVAMVPSLKGSDVYNLSQAIEQTGKPEGPPTTDGGGGWMGHHGNKTLVNHIREPQVVFQTLRILQVHNPWMPSDKTRGEESHDPKAVITTYEGNHNHDIPTSKSSRDHDTKPRFRPDETDTISLNLGVGISSDGPDYSHHT